MIIETVGTYPEADKLLAGGTDVAILQGGDSQVSVWCHVMISPDNGALASKITEQFGWRETNRQEGHIILYAHKKKTEEIISALGSLTS